MQEHSEKLAAQELNGFDNVSLISGTSFNDIERGERTSTSDEEKPQNGSETPLPSTPPKSESDTETEVSTDEEVEREAADYVSLGWNVST